ncbi:mandelate racemase/muconate lactonizing enzyme family protein [Jiangella asiatica]|uniref:Mandelate racemase/muconate lactonizing enzyme family protein n=1 Tax=Jiangella asiatica TaxID=2530372 RepID=A0A4R5CS55_9ACTN|nr:mandelate racemase/muconate lactonizing enzyme family protein [Jiangella asiatica]TDE03106.1 mandelate racemase/muconate lactonizing enzyme family protein [Jiangella asiatica]
MKLVALETLRPAFQPNVCMVLLHTDEGLTGLGEAYFSPTAVEAYLHDSAAPLVLGQDDLGPERLAGLLEPYVGYQGGGIEKRALGAIDIALWDLLGKRAELPVAELLGGPVRDDIRIYNTCAGPGYVSQTARQHSSNWGLGTTGRYEDLRAFLTRPAELTEDLLAQGVTGMKVWPFDSYAEASRGTEITPIDLADGLRVIEQIRSVAGPADMAIMVELHGLWSRPAATRICQALAPYEPYWVEDPLRGDAVDAFARLAADVDVPVATGETCVGTRGFLPLLRTGAIDVVTVDTQWTGGITHARKVAALAETFGVPLAPHDCTGPVSFAACCHLVLSQPNGLIQETVRAFLHTWYGELVDGLPEVADGTVRLSRRPGLGVDLADRMNAPDVARRVTRL